MGHRAGEEYWKVKDRDRFWEVIAQGGSLAAAAASVGVTRAAGLRWLRNGLIPEWCRQKIIDRVQPGTGPLTFVERGWIQEMCRVGFTTSEMARLLGRSRSTIWRELPKGIHETWGTYRAVVAQRTVDAARARPKTRKLETNDELRAQVVEGLAKNWSPQQIAARLRLDHPGDKEMRVCHETIYQAIYVQPRVDSPVRSKTRSVTVKSCVMGARVGRNKDAPAGASHWESTSRYMTGPKRSRNALSRGIGKAI